MGKKDKHEDGFGTDPSSSGKERTVQQQEEQQQQAEKQALDEIIGDSTNSREDGRIDIDLSSRLFRTLSLLDPKRASAPITKNPHQLEEQPPAYSKYIDPGIRLNIVIQVVGSRGDVQPFIALGCGLQRHGHRVRLATHDSFADFVTQSGLEFFPIGGDPTELMAYMVRNPGLVPSMKSLRAGEVQKKRKMVAEMLEGCWRSPVEPDPKTQRPFVAEAIIANPPSFAHIHCAQVLGIPLHLMFTMPWTSTKAFCHPLANVTSKGARVPVDMANYMSYLAVELMTWQGLGDIINAWRHTLDLEPVPFSEGACLAETLKIPFTYCWSPSLVPKPEDWAENIDVCGFFFRDPPKYTPYPELDAFLRAGTAPVYIGFGSIVVDDPDGMTAKLVQAVHVTGQRALISRGWSKLGMNQPENPNILYLDDCPHEWLFQHVAAVIHHGGAGTTACGLQNGRPTMIVPFFGDQPFWGEMVAAAGAGPSPIGQKQLTSENLAEAITFCLTPEALTAAGKIASSMCHEDGVQQAVASFHANLPLNSMRCDVQPHLPAAWCFKKNSKYYKLSKAAAEVATERGCLNWSSLKRYESNVIRIENRRWDPVTATTSSLVTTGGLVAKSAADVVYQPIKVFSRRHETGEAPSEASSAAVSVHSSDDIYGQPAAMNVPLKPPGSADQHSKEKSRFAEAAVGSAAGLGGFFKHLSKGMLLDMPYAATEGLRNAPRLYNGEVYDPGPITDWKSGGIAGGKIFAHGIVEGIGGLVTKPMRGAKEQGALGAAKGAGVGVLDLSTKMLSGTLGLLMLPGQGIYQSVRDLTNRDTRNLVCQYRRQEGRDAVLNGGVDGRHVDEEEVLRRLDDLGMPEVTG